MPDISLKNTSFSKSMWELVSDKYYKKCKVSKDENTVLLNAKKVEEHPQQKE